LAAVISLIWRRLINSARKVFRLCSLVERSGIRVMSSGIEVCPPTSSRRSSSGLAS